jgi:arginine decarboxylase
MEYSAKGERRQIEEIVRTMAVEGMMLRGREIKALQSIAVEHTVENIGASLAAVVLWASS